VNIPILFVFLLTQRRILQSMMLLGMKGKHDEEKY